MNYSSIKFLLNLNELINYEKQLEQTYPYIYGCLPAGIESIVDCLMCSYMTEEERILETYLEECMIAIDYNISLEEASNETMSQFSESAASELYSYEFYEYLSRIYNLLQEKITHLLSTKNFTVVNYNMLNRNCKLFLEVTYR